MLIKYLYFRIKQAWRATKDIGLGFLLVAAIICFGFLINLLAQLGKLPAWGMAIALSTIPLSIHFNRNDITFLKKYYPRTFPLLFSEYYLLVLPLALLLAIVFKKWIILFQLAPLILIIALIPPIQLKSRNKPILNLHFIPFQLFEWRSGFRRNGIFMAICYVIGLACAFYPAGPLVSIIIISYIMTNFYDELEAPIMIEQFAPLSLFMLKKLQWHLSALLLLFLPLGMAFLIFHLSYWYLLLIALVFSLALISFALCYKYSVYRPHRKKAFNQNAIALFSAGMFIPLFLPGSIYFLFRFSRKAKNRLNWFYSKQ
ncbi:MAG: hypothetical protein MK226_09760 [Saprospiraceae bacterium]|nr:hypothetical protein [Saprospiraceae bacterium]